MLLDPFNTGVGGGGSISLTIGIDATTAINLTNGVNGYRHGSFASPMTNTSYTIAANPVEGGWAFLFVQTASAPTFTGIDRGAGSISTNFVANEANQIAFHYVGGEVTAQWIRSFSNAWTPESEASLVGWWDHTNIDGSSNSTLTDGADFTTWVARNSGGPSLTGTAIYRASGPHVEFDGVNDVLANNAVGVTTQPYTISVVVVNDGVSNVLGSCIWSNGSASSTFLAHFNATQVRTVSGGTFSSRHTLTNNVSQLVTIVFNGVSTEYFLNGTSVFTGDVGSDSLNNIFRLGAVNSANYQWAGFIEEAVLYNGALDSTARTNNDDFLIAKYGI